jgi:serine/threonine-protein kinase
VPTTYHYWASFKESRRGPGYLRRWIAGETVGARLRRTGADDVPATLRLLREIGSAVAYLHDSGHTYGSLSPDTVWTAPMGRLWIINWQWAVPLSEIPPAVSPAAKFMASPPEWADGVWAPTMLSDQWQVGALCFAVLTGETPPSIGVPPIRLVRPDVPDSVARVIDRALAEDPRDRFASVTQLLRAVERVVGSRSMMILGESAERSPEGQSDEARLRWMLAEDYEVLAKLGSGSFGSVWRVRDLTLGREVALKLLHPHVARDERSVTRFRREAKLAAQLAHPAIVPIFDWDNRGDITWYTMELAEGGSVADLVARSGPRPLSEIAPQIDFVLAGLSAAHAVGVVHRDLKPENILIDRYRRWRIADFGIANAAGEDRASASGTPAFAAPEQLLGEVQDTAADSFSLAAIVAFTLTGEAPFGDRDVNTILARELKGDIDLEGFDPEIAEWLRRGLSPNAEERFADAAAMQTAWREAVQSVFEREHRAPWWRRWFGADTEQPPAWAADPSMYQL